MRDRAVRRFLARVKRTEGCWLWRGNIEPVTGRPRYGQRWAHRVAYELFVGELLPDHEIHHRCETKRCVNPAHLEQLTHDQHLTVHAAGRTDGCRRGHDVKHWQRNRCALCRREQSRARDDTGFRDRHYTPSCDPERDLVLDLGLAPVEALATHLARRIFVAKLTAAETGATT